MNKVQLTIMALAAGSILASPAQSAQRKTLFEVLFPKAHELREKRKKQRQQVAITPESQQSEVQVKKKKPVRVETSRYYAYRTVKRAAIAITPLKLEYAAANVPNGPEQLIASDTGSQSVNDPSTQMTIDLHKVGKTGMSAENYLAAAVSDYYSKNQDYRWLNQKGEYNARARSVMKLFAEADKYGLRPQDYLGIAIHESVNAASQEEPEVSLAKLRVTKEVAFSIATLRYAMDAKYGMINPNRLSGYHDFPVHHDKAGTVFADLMGKGLPNNSLLEMHPSNAKFEALRTELVRLAAERGDAIDLPTKILIRPGMVHDSLPEFVAAIKKRGSTELLEKHSETFLGYYGSTIYSNDLYELVKAYQQEAGLGPDGIIGPRTARKLAGISPELKEMRVHLAMERLRWHPHQLGERHVFINQPEYRARYIENGDEKLSMRVVVGKKANQTNFFYDEIEHVVYNPYWGVPRSIIVNEFRPKSIGNPSYLDQLGYELRSFSGRRISSSSINWSAVGEHPKFEVRQPPGAKNALGQVKIMFPNKHSIYMHDTPSKHLFKKQARAFSHGCVRLHDPKAMAAAVLGTSKGHVSSRISTGANKTEKLKRKVPVYVSYFTAWPQQDGTVKYFHDVYDRDAHLLKAMEATRTAREKPLTS